MHVHTQMISKSYGQYMKTCKMFSNQHMKRYFCRLKKELLTIKHCTCDILDQLASVVFPLRILDQSGFLIDQCCKLVLQFLKKRSNFKEDVILWVDKYINSGNFIPQCTNGNAIMFNSEEMLYYDQLPANWVPDPAIDNLNPIISLSSKIGEPINIIANMFDSAEDLIYHYKILNSNRILHGEYDTDPFRLVTSSRFVVSY